MVVIFVVSLTVSTNITFFGKWKKKGLFCCLLHVCGHRFTHHWITGSRAEVFGSCPLRFSAGHQLSLVAFTSSSSFPLEEPRKLLHTRSRPLDSTYVPVYSPPPNHSSFYRPSCERIVKLPTNKQSIICIYHKHRTASPYWCLAMQEHCFYMHASLLVTLQHVGTFQFVEWTKPSFNLLCVFVCVCVGGCGCMCVFVCACVCGLVCVCVNRFAANQL